MTVGQALRETVRHNAIVAHVSDDDFLIADTFTTADASPLVERIRGAIAATRSGSRPASGWCARHCRRWPPSRPTRCSTS